MRKLGFNTVVALAVAALALAAAGCGGSNKSSSDNTSATSGNVTALPASACTPVEFEGSGDPDTLIVSDLPMQGSSRTQTVQMV